jgi:hypothetical protein
MASPLLYPLPMKLSNLLLASLTLLPVAACMNKDGGGLGSDTAESQMDQQDSVEAEGNMMMEATDGADLQSAVPLTAEQVAVRIAANITARWSPSTCVAVTQTGATVKVVYDDCTGSRRHLIHVSGELDLAISVELSGAIDVHATSDSMRVNGADLEVDATAQYTRTGDDREIVVHSTGSGTGPRGNAIEHQGDYTLTWNPTSQCGSVAGHWQTDFTGATATAERSNDVDVSRCATGCPTGTITHHYLRGASMTITFDGTATAAWSTSLGGTGTVTLQCQ